MMCRTHFLPNLLVGNNVGLASPYVHLRQPKTLYLNPNLTLAPQSDPKPNPKPYHNPNHIT